MLSTHCDTTRATVSRKPKLIGYVLASKKHEQGSFFSKHLEEKATKLNSLLDATEWDVGIPSNPVRLGLWRALRRLICNRCEPKRMSFSILNFDDFLDQALAPCHCSNPSGYDGIIVYSLQHLTSHFEKGSRLVLKLAALGKHVYAEDGLCLSCCHPAAQAMIRRSM